MKLETTASNLHSALKCLRAVVERRSTIPILGAVKFQGGKVTGTNLDIDAEVAIPTIGQQDGEAVIDYSGITTLAGLIDADEHVSLDEAEGLATVAFNGSQYKLASYPTNDFPSMAAPEGEAWLTGNAGLVAAMKQVKFAVSTEETRYYLNGVCIIREPDAGVVVAATDGHRLAMAPIEAAPDVALGKIFPSRLVNYITARKGEPKAVTIDVAKPKAKIEYDGLVLTAKLIDGTYPDIFRVVPKDAVPYFTVNRSVILPALRRVLAFSQEAYREVKISGGTDGLTLDAKYGERVARERIPCTMHSEPFEVGYNVRYLIEAFEAFAGETVTLACTPGLISGNPAIMTGDNDGLRVVIMPMRV